ncbi:membrane protein YdbS with pleckstrin-like domain [Bacillus chungangensis]|uniref:Membrane protein YdbS with pleckstrin-like domain n=1 Tax=Bacillus chungangensis TaxID=587633 RepID=A0ABT9WXU1_9BACI|nr:membrane protein YdbS with pleckstrin-like domain [Bacillus chungangensis]
MEMQVPQKRISVRALPVWRITGLIIALFVWVLIIGGSIFVYMKELSFWLIVVGIFVGLLITLLFTYLIPFIRWKRWRYEVRDQEIELQHGVFFMKKTLVPMIRVQHVDTVQGPILRKYDLATITIATAATVHQIPAVDLNEAEEMRRAISQLARVAEEDV